MRSFGDASGQSPPLGVHRIRGYSPGREPGRLRCAARPALDRRRQRRRRRGLRRALPRSPGWSPAPRDALHRPRGGCARRGAGDLLLSARQVPRLRADRAPLHVPVPGREAPVRGRPAARGTLRQRGRGHSTPRWRGPSRGTTARSSGRSSASCRLRSGRSSCCASSRASRWRRSASRSRSLWGPSSRACTAR